MLSPVTSVLAQQKVAPVAQQAPTQQAPTQQAPVQQAPVQPAPAPFQPAVATQPVAPAQPAVPAQAAPAPAPPAASDAAPLAAEGGSRPVKSTLPVLHELSPWSMFLAADIIVKAVM
ncbi:MAG: tonB-system energizer ExbB, partial [Bradyrhizobium sp.]